MSLVRNGLHYGSARMGHGVAHHTPQTYAEAWYALAQQQWAAQQHVQLAQLGYGPGVNGTYGSQASRGSGLPATHDLLTQKLSVFVGRAEPKPGVYTAHAAFQLHKNRNAGLTALHFGFPSTRQSQHTILASLKLEVLDQSGRRVSGAIRHHTVGPAVGNSSERSELSVDLDLARLPQPAFFKFSVDVNIDDTPQDLSQPVPLDALQPVPAEARPFVAPGKEIQSEHPEIKALAQQLRSQSSTVQELVGQTLAAMAEIRQAPSDDPYADVASGLDALCFLRTGVGSCTSNANLFAALMRANGVPTRVTNEISHGAGQDMHFVNEYYMPGTGWVHVEPQGQDLQTPRYFGIDTGVAFPEQEQGRSEYWTGIWGEERDASGRPLTHEQRSVVTTHALYVPNNYFAPEQPKGFAIATPVDGRIL